MFVFYFAMSCYGRASNVSDKEERKRSVDSFQITDSEELASKFFTFPLVCNERLLFGLPVFP